MKIFFVDKPKIPGSILIVVLFWTLHKYVERSVDANPLRKRIVPKKAKFGFEIFNRIAQHRNKYSIRIRNLLLLGLPLLKKHFSKNQKIY